MKSVFIAHPFNKLNTIEGESHLIEYLQSKLKDQEFNVITSYDVYSTSLGEHASVSDAINRSFIVIGVLTRDSSNVFYEIGYAIGSRKKVLLIAQPEIDLPKELLAIQRVRADYHWAEIWYEVQQEVSKPLETSKFSEPQHELNPDEIIRSYDTNPEYFERIDARTFEDVVKSLFMSKGYVVTEPNPKEHFGFDFMLTGPSHQGEILVEVKKQNPNRRTSIGDIQQLLGAVYAYDAASGILITTSVFTDSALDFASKMSPRIQLWNMDRLKTALL
jgi:HJR/Mrr/RecB family endonuclease